MTDVTTIPDATAEERAAALLYAWVPGDPIKQVKVAISDLPSGDGGDAGGSGKWFRTFRPTDNEPPSANYATLDTRNSRPVLEFDAAAQEGAVFTGVMGADYADGTITVDIFIAADTAAAGDFIFDAAFERTDLSSLDIDVDNFAAAKTFAATTAPATPGQVVKASLNFTQAEAAGISAGEIFRLRLRRLAANVGDTMAGDAQLLAAHVREA